MKKLQESMVITPGRVTRPGLNGRSNRSGKRRCSLLVGVALGIWTSAAAAQEHHQYQVRVAADLSAVTVKAQFAVPVAALRAAQGRSEDLRGLRRCDTGELRIHRNRIVGQAIECLEYEYPLVPAQDRRNPPVAEGVRVTTPAGWLWQPTGSDSRNVQVIFSLPADTNVSTPWRTLGEGRFEVSASPGSSTAIVVFGRFDEAVIDAGDANLRVALVDGPDQRLNRRKVLSWLEASVVDVVSVGGRFPSRGVQVIVQPVPPRSNRDSSGGRSAVPFGYVIRDGGESVRFFVDAARPLEDFLSDWTATHEFSHLLLPYVRSKEKWISEGFASYYQNVLLARRGIYSPLQAWQRLDRAFTQANSVVDPPLLSGIDERPFWEMRMLIYWSGAAMALMADVRLRELSDGRESLDSVLARLAACCLPSERTWQGEELFSQLDSLSPHPVFVRLYREYSGGVGMPDLQNLYGDLGLNGSEAGLSLRDDARLASIREAIMQGSD